MSLQKAREDICKFIVELHAGTAGYSMVSPETRARWLAMRFERYETELLKANGLERSEGDE